MTISIEQREEALVTAAVNLEAAAALWLEQRAKRGALMPRKYDLALDLAMIDYRRAARRLEEARKRAVR